MIEIFNRPGIDRQTVISSWVSLTFDRRLAQKGRFELVINANTKQASEISLGQIVYFSEKECGYIDRIEVRSQQNIANENMHISGIELKDTIESRITFPPAGEEFFNYVDETTENIIIDLLNKLLINPSDARKKVPFFALGPTVGGGKLRDFSTRLKPLGQQIFELLIEDGLGIKCDLNIIDKKAYFSVIRGLDRTASQSINTRVVFSISRGTLQSAVTTKDTKAYKSTAYVGGLGSGIDRLIVESPENNTISGLDRWETFIDARDVATEDELIFRGNARLVECGKIYSIDGVISQNKNLQFDLGDLVTIIDNMGNSEDVQISGITNTMTGVNIKSTSLIFGQAPMSLSQALNIRLAGLENLITS